MLTYISCFSLLPGIVLLLLFQPFKGSVFNKTVACFLLTYFVLESLGFVLAMYKTNNLWVYHLVSISEIIFLTVIYRQSVKSKLKKLILPIGIVTLLFLIINSSMLEPLNVFNGDAKLISGLISIVFALIWFIDLFVQPNHPEITKSPMFYLSTGVIIYFSNSIFIFSYYTDLMKNEPAALDRLWNYHLIMNIVYNTFLSLAVWMMIINKKKVLYESKQTN